MSTRREERARIALLQGTLDPLILRTLLFGPQHGQGIARAIQQQSEDTFLVDHSSLYPALQRLEARGWIRKQLVAATEQWRRLSTAIGRILGSEKA